MTKTFDTAKLDRISAQARRAAEERSRGYREQALKLFPWVCGRCGREFTRANVRELTVHHKDHDHDNNPADGSNWENLCVYCHDDIHSRETLGDYLGGSGGRGSKGDVVYQDEEASSGFGTLADKLRKAGKKG